MPVGRIAVNMTAGAVGYSRRRFMQYSAVAAVLWGCYMLAMGVLASIWFAEQPLLAMAVGIAAGVLLGLLVDRLVGLVFARDDDTSSGPEDLAGVPPCLATATTEGLGKS